MPSYDNTQGGEQSVALSITHPNVHSGFVRGLAADGPIKSILFVFSIRDEILNLFSFRVF